MWLFHCWRSFACTGFHSESRYARNWIFPSKCKCIIITTFISIEIVFSIKKQCKSLVETFLWVWKRVKCTLLWCFNWERVTRKAHLWTRVKTEQGFCTLRNVYEILKNGRKWKRKSRRWLISSFTVSWIFNRLFLLTSESSIQILNLGLTSAKWTFEKFLRR